MRQITGHEARSGGDAARTKRSSAAPFIWRRMLVAVVVAGSILGESSMAQEPRPETVEPPGQGEVAPSNPVKQPARIDILEFQISGNSVLDVTTIETAVYPFLGPARTFEDIDKARASLEKLYHNAGYGTVLVDIPEQDVVGGVVRLRVIEGRVSRLRVTGARYFSPMRIRRQLPALAPGDIPNLAESQRQIAEFNRKTNDRSIVPILRPGKTPGTVEMELKVRDELPLHGSLEANNRYSSGTTHQRLLGAVRYDNLFQRQHSLGVQYQTSPRDREEVDVWSATYLWRPPRGDTLWVMYGLRSRSSVAAVGDLTVIGRGNILGARAIVPLRQVGEASQRLTFGVDRKDFADNILTPIEYQTWSAQYHADRRGSSSTSRFSVGVNFGVRGLGNDPREFADRRFLARPNYFTLRGGVEHTHRMWADTAASFKLDAQAADGPLVSNEQFGAGGADSVRGYPEVLQLGDNGARASLELHSPPLAGTLGEDVDELNLLAFIDYARVRLQDPLPDQLSRFTLESAGIGARARAWRRWHAELDWARALKDSGAVAAGDQRLHFRLEYSF